MELLFVCQIFKPELLIQAIGYVADPFLLVMQQGELMITAMQIYNLPRYLSFITLHLFKSNLFQEKNSMNKRNTSMSCDVLFQMFLVSNLKTALVSYIELTKYLHLSLYIISDSLTSCDTSYDSIQEK